MTNGHSASDDLRSGRRVLLTRWSALLVGRGRSLELIDKRIVGCCCCIGWRLACVGVGTTQWVWALWPLDLSFVGGHCRVDGQTWVCPWECLVRAVGAVVGDVEEMIFVQWLDSHCWLMWNYWPVRRSSRRSCFSSANFKREINSGKLKCYFVMWAQFCSQNNLTITKINREMNRTIKNVITMMKTDYWI